MLEGHTDVVSEGNRARGRMTRSGRVVGREGSTAAGSCDMKAGLAVALVTAKAFRTAGIAWKGKIRLGLVCDEEGMMIGIKHFIRGGPRGRCHRVPGARSRRRTTSASA